MDSLCWSYCIDLWDILSETDLQPGVEDTHMVPFGFLAVLRPNWFTQDYSKEHYSSGYGNVFGKPGAPGKSHFFMWLVVHNKRWTANQPGRQGL